MHLDFFSYFLPKLSTEPKTIGHIFSNQKIKVVEKCNKGCSLSLIVTQMFQWNDFQSWKKPCKNQNIAILDGSVDSFSRRYEKNKVLFWSVFKVVFYSWNALPDILILNEKCTLPKPLVGFIYTFSSSLSCSSSLSE